MLEIDMDFAKKVAVPGVSNLQELGAVLNESHLFNSADINQTLGIIQQRTGVESVGVGIKTVLDCIFEAKAGGEGVLETFAELMIDQIQYMRE